LLGSPLSKEGVHPQSSAQKEKDVVGLNACEFSGGKRKTPNEEALNQRGEKGRNSQRPDGQVQREGGGGVRASRPKKQKNKRVRKESDGGGKVRKKKRMPPTETPHQKGEGNGPRLERKNPTLISSFFV